MWELIVAFLSATIVLPILQQPRWSTGARATLTFIYTIAVGLVTAYLTGAFAGVHDVHSGISAVLTMLVGVIAFYHGFAQPTGIAPAIEAATSPNSFSASSRR
jgi:hypothetical protein